MFNLEALLVDPLGRGGHDSFQVDKSEDSESFHSKTPRIWKELDESYLLHWSAALGSQGGRSIQPRESLRDFFLVAGPWDIKTEMLMSPETRPFWPSTAPQTHRYRRSFRYEEARDCSCLRTASEQAYEVRLERYQAFLAKIVEFRQPDLNNIGKIL